MKYIMALVLCLSMAGCVKEIEGDFPVSCHYDGVGLVFNGIMYVKGTYVPFDGLLTGKYVIKKDEKLSCVLTFPEDV